MLGALEREYDEAGNITYEKNFGADGQPAATEKGYGAFRREYNGQRKVIYEAWYDTEGQPMRMNGDTYYALRREYDEAGNVTCEWYCDVDGEKIARNEGYDTVRQEFDELNRVVRISYYAGGWPVLTNLSA